MNTVKRDWDMFCHLFPQLIEFVKSYTIDAKIDHGLIINMKSEAKLYFVYDPKVEGSFTLTTQRKVIDSIRGGRY